MTQALDDRDIRILAILAAEGRIAKTELARRVNLSTTPCWERLKRLEASGLIRGYHADVAAEKLGPSVTIFVAAELETHRAESFRIFEDAVAREEEIIACWAVGGGIDYMMQVMTTDIDRYQRLIDDLLARRIGLRRYFSYIVTKATKPLGPPPLPLIAGLPED